jgi:hypothetical protein
MKKLIILITSSLLIVNYTISQTHSYWLLKGIPENTKQILHLGAEASWGSNSLNNEWLSEMTIGGHIGREQKNLLFQNMEDYNRVGASLMGELTVYSFVDSVFGSQQWGLTGGVSHVSATNSYFGKDFFDLVYFGNARSAGDTLDFGKMYGQLQSFQKFGIGIFNKENLSAIRLSYVSGINYLNLQVDRARWFTSPTSGVTSLDYDATYEQADTTKSGAFTSRGQGFCIDADLNIPMKKDQGFFAISVRNIGYTHWQNSIHYAADSVFTWDGIEIGDILNVSADSIELPSWQDTLGISGERISKWRALPGSIQFRMIKKINSKSSYEAGIMLQPNYAALPLVSLGYNHFVAKGLMLTERLNYGGYGRLAVGLEMQYLLGEKLFLRAGTQHLFGVMSAQARGGSAFLGFSLVL